MTADAFSPGCIQRVLGSRLPWTAEFMHQGEVSEDCLTLNVWTPAQRADEKLAVMVYFYGGGFSEGSSAVAVYDGEALARKGVVLVSANYRVGPLGFMAHPELTAESEHGASGNYGLLDAVAALEWVRRNIAAFGGDPEQITIFGQSAGAALSNLLMVSPLARGLFARAVLHSGPGLIPGSMISGGTPLAQAEEAGRSWAESKGAATLADLRALPVDSLLPGMGLRFGPVTDGWFLPVENPHEREVPVMIGFTANDLGAGGAFGPPPASTVEAFEEEARQRYGEAADQFLALYPAVVDSVVDALRKEAGRDRARVSIGLWADRQAPLSGSVRTYYFDRAIPWPEHPEFGAFHTGEIPYVFNNLAKLDRPWEPVDHEVADQMSTYWTQFAKTGDPNTAGLPEWPLFAESGDVTMEIGARMGSMPLASPERVVFWKAQMSR